MKKENWQVQAPTTLISMSMIMIMTTIQTTLKAITKMTKKVVRRQWQLAVLEALLTLFKCEKHRKIQLTKQKN